MNDQEMTGDVRANLYCGNCHGVTEHKCTIDYSGEAELEAHLVPTVNCHCVDCSAMFYKGGLVYLLKDKVISLNPVAEESQPNETFRRPHVSRQSQKQRRDEVFRMLHGDKK